MDKVYGYRSIRTIVPAVAGSIARGSEKRNQYKGQNFILSDHRGINILINLTDGVTTHITVLDNDGKALAKLEPNAII